MADKLALTLACGPYDRTEALRYGIIQPEGIDLTYESVEPPPVVVDRMVKDQEFDISEMFLGLYMSLRSKNQFPFVAIPAFPSRVFRHSFIFVNTRSGIKSPKDLEGKRVGVPEFRQTAAVWIKGILQHDYGVDLRTIQWFEGGVNQARPRDMLDLVPEGDITPQFIAEGRTLNDMLEKGELDAVAGARRPASFGKNPDIKRLFPDPRKVERDYYLKTSIFPIMHTVVLKESLYQQHPWVANRIYKAMYDAKAWMWQRMRATGTPRFMLPWMFDDMEEMDQLFGGDGWPYGVEPNRHTLETFMGYLVEQRLMSAPVPLESLFVGES